MPDLLEEFRREVGFTLGSLTRAAVIYGELGRLGVKPDIPGLLFSEWIPKISAGLLAAEAVVAFSDARSMLQELAKMPVADQRRYAAGELVAVVPAVDAEPVPMTLRESYDRGFRHVARAGQVLSPADQQRQLKAKPAKAVKKKAVTIATPTPRGPATEAETEALAARVDRELQVRGGARPTAKWIAEVVAMVGWAPRGG